jgi:GxxExxY protein
LKEEDIDSRKDAKKKCPRIRLPKKLLTQRTEYMLLLRPGLLESVYEAVLEHELKKRGLNVVRQAPMPVVYGSMRLEEGYRADLIVEGKVIVELKSVEEIAPVHKKQLLT